LTIDGAKAQELFALMNPRSAPGQASVQPPVLAPAPSSPNRANAEAHKTRGDMYREANDYADAIAAYKQALALDPSYRPALYVLAVTYSSAEQWEESVAAWEKYLADAAHESSDANGSALNLLGNSHRQLKHYDKARETLQRAIDLKPKPQILSSSYHFLGRTYGDLEQHEKAVAAYQEAVRVNPADGSSYREMGVSLFRLNRNDQAVMSLQQAIRLRANDGLAYYDLGYIYLAMGRKAEARQVHQKLQSIDASRAQKLAADIAKQTPASEAYQAGWKQFNDHEYDKAIPSLLEAARLDPNSLDAYMVLGDAYGRTMQFDKAAAAYKRALEVQPDDQYALRYLGTAYMMMGNKREALEMHSRLAKIDRTSGELLLADVNRPGGPAAILASNAQAEMMGGHEGIREGLTRAQGIAADQSGQLHKPVARRRVRRPRQSPRGARRVPRSRSTEPGQCGRTVRNRDGKSGAETVRPGAWTVPTSGAARAKEGPRLLPVGVYVFSDETSK
jgi:tetratricopeptide (TPR) repeat protein